jgi:CHAT domain-containing protein
MDLDGNRRWVENNTRDLFLPCCAGVELWAATSGLGPVEGILHDDEDRIPGLARAFLLSGATGALDLAWPVHDLVKALVCERFTTLRRCRGVAAADALTAAVAWSAELLSRWRGVAISAPSIRDALGWLDNARRAAASDAGLHPGAVVPFAACQNAPSIAGKSASEIADEVNSPIHYAAFRLWGWFR